MKKTVLFDGDCNFCNKSVQFIIKRDPKGFFQFTSLQSDIGLSLLKKHNLPNYIDSIVLIDNDRAFIESTAALRICKNLRGIWKLFYIFLVVPQPLRNVVYKVIANSRYKFFGKKETCRLPTPEERERFLT